METKHTPGPITVETISGSSGGVVDVAEVNMKIVAPGYTVDGIGRLIASAPDLLAQRDRLIERNKVLEDVLRALLYSAASVLDARGKSTTNSLRMDLWAAINSARAALAQEE